MLRLCPLIQRRNMKNEDPLHEKLRTWKVDAAIPRSFSADVWARIRAREEERAATGLSGFIRWLLPSPLVWKFATATVVVMLALGVGLGNLTARNANDENRSRLAQRYVQSVDPYLQLSRHTP